jgi:hypothetical protein
MAKIPQGAFKDWRNGQIMSAEDWQREREMLRIQGNDNYERLQSLELASDNLRLSDNFASPTLAASSYPLGSSVFKADTTEWRSAVGASDTALFVETNKDASDNAVQTITTQSGKARMWVRQSQAGAWLAPIEFPTMDRVQTSKITNDVGGVKLSLQSSSDDLLATLRKEGQGYHTFYAVGSVQSIPEHHAVRGFAHLTDGNNGYVKATDTTGKAHENYINNGVWSGWKKANYAEDLQNIIWTGNRMPTNTDITTPSKKLSECRNGWVLVWSDFTPSPENAANDYDYVMTPVFKGITSVKNGGSHLVIVPNYLSDTLKDYVVKRINIFDDRILGHENNNQSGGNDVTLRYILEW